MEQRGKRLDGQKQQTNSKQTEALTLLYISHFGGIYRVKLVNDKRIKRAQRNQSALIMYE